jgi:hypothetical protein
MLTAEFDNLWVDPFAARQQPLTIQSGGAVGGAQPAAAAVGPQEAGLTLTSVTIGLRRRAATINDETYRENELVVVGDKDHPQVEMKFRLVRIGAQSVELERGGQTFVLELSKPKLGAGDDVRRVKLNPNN